MAIEIEHIKKYEMQQKQLWGDFVAKHTFL